LLLTQINSRKRKKNTNIRKTKKRRRKVTKKRRRTKNISTRRINKTSENGPAHSAFLPQP